MDNIAPAPSGTPRKTAVAAASQPAVVVSSPKDKTPMYDSNNPSAVSVTIAGCGGCGINLARPFVNIAETTQPVKVLFFDTSMTNTRFGETAEIVGTGSGSGSNRIENASEIERSIPQYGVDEMGDADVAIVMFSLAGGSGSVIGPLLVREYAKRGKRVIAVCVADTSYSVGAKNSLNTLKTLTSICKNNNLYLPVILLSNDQSPSRRLVDETAVAAVADLIDLLTKPVYEVDRNDRLNWINPTKIVDSAPGLKLMSFSSDKKPGDPKIVLGTESNAMVDSLLILQASSDEAAGDAKALPPARLKKTGFYNAEHRRIVGKVSSDVEEIEKIIDFVERMQHQDKAQKHKSINRLDSDGKQDDLIF